MSQPSVQPATCHIIVVGNEKGGSGKSTAVMHLAVGLLRLGFRVVTMDLDSRQSTLSRYFYNRRKRESLTGKALPQPTHMTISFSKEDSAQAAQADESQRLAQAITQLKAAHDFIIIDTPGTDCHLNRAAHAYADTLVTPINDSFVDFALLGSIDPENRRMMRPSIYAEMVWEQRKQKMVRTGSQKLGNIDWIVMRNRLSTLNARNKKDMEESLGILASRIGFRIAPGFSERVIFRELFLHGLTMMDVMEDSGGQQVTMSHIAARQEVRGLLAALNIPAVTARLASSQPANSNQPDKEEEAA